MNVTQTGSGTDIRMHDQMQGLVQWWNIRMRFRIDPLGGESGSAPELEQKKNHNLESMNNAK